MRLDRPERRNALDAGMTRALLDIVRADPAVPVLLDLAVGSPALAIERRAFLNDGRVVEYTTSIYRGDAYDFVAELHGE